MPTYEQMLARLSCDTTLPQIPLAATKLCQLVDQELISQEVLRTVASDPALTAGLLRAASSPLYALSPKPVTEMRTALSILGVRGAKSVSMSVLMQSVISGSHRSHLDPVKFVQHSSFVGIMAKYVFLRRRQAGPFETAINGDELFAAGILHDLGVGLIAVGFPEEYNRIAAEAAFRQISFQTVFEEQFGPLDAVTAGAFKAWKLPEVFWTLIGHDVDPEKEQIARAALAYSDYLAVANGFGLGNETAVLPDECVLEAVGLSEAEVAGAVAQVASHTESCLIRPRAA